MDHPLPHESLDAYRLALDVARWLRVVTFPRGEAGLRDQARRAAESVVLNLAEGCSSQGGNRQRHFFVARGSAAEVVAVLDLLDLPDSAAKQAQLRRVVAMICKLR